MRQVDQQQQQQQQQQDLMKQFEPKHNNKNNNTGFDDEEQEDEGIKKTLAESEVVSGSSVSTFLSLLSSKDRDFLLSPSGNQVKISDLRSKVVAIYFSANWYPPCKKFNEVLTDVYKQLVDNNVGFEVVFVSSDEDSDAFSAYHASMPWLAIPFSDLETKKALNQRFNVEGIPCLVVLQPSGNKDEAIMYDGVELVCRYGAEAFPFTKERLEKLQEEEKEKHEKQTLKDLLTNNDRDFVLGYSASDKVPVSSLTGKTIGLYFSAKWCVPGIKFTSKLILAYQKIKRGLTEGHDDFEIVYVSSDNTLEEFESHFEGMPWLTLPYGDPTAKDLAKYFDIRGIPSLVIVGRDGKTITKQGRNLISLYREKAFPFTQARKETLEREMDEEAKCLPKNKSHVGHRHELSLVSEGTGGGPYICCDCDEQGYGWAYQCLECGYEVHPNCVRPIKEGPTS